MSEEIRGRFPPSPTGMFHIGNAHTALFNWLFVRHCKGKFILRIEDTDRARLVEGAIEDILDGLRWLGITWDEGPDIGGPFGPYVQSQRLSLYREYAHKLLGNGSAYYCFCTSERLRQVSEERQKKGELSGYDRRCRYLSSEEVESYRTQFKAQGIEPIVRLKVPETGETTFHDLIRGDITFNNSLLTDQVLLKSDGYPTYHLANVVDDYLMRITHVMRGDDWIPSTPYHILLYGAFDFELPKFAHLPIILGPDKSKLSKRHGATSLTEYRKRGYLSHAMLNFLALLGWSPGDDREKMSLDEIIAAFSMEGISSKGVVFDEQKLEWLNGEYIKDLELNELLKEVLPYLLEAKLLQEEEIDKKKDWLLKIITLLRERVRRLSEFADSSIYFFRDPVEYEEHAQKQHWKSPETSERLSVLKSRLGELDEFSVSKIEGVLRILAEELNISAAKLIHPARLAITGRSYGPGLFELMEVVGRGTVLRRLNKAIEFINGRKQTVSF